MQTVDKNIIDRLLALEAMGAMVNKEAAMLRKELLAVHQPVTPRKGKQPKVSADFLAQIDVLLTKKYLKKGLKHTT